MNSLTTVHLRHFRSTTQQRKINSEGTTSMFMAKWTSDAYIAVCFLATTQSVKRWRYDSMLRLYITWDAARMTVSAKVCEVVSLTWELWSLLKNLQEERFIRFSSDLTWQYNPLIELIQLSTSYNRASFSVGLFLLLVMNLCWMRVYPSICL